MSPFVAKLGAFATYLVVAVIVAGLFGALHDQISFSVSHEYFTKFKFVQFGWAGAELPDRVRVAQIGFLASWWMGIPLGLFTGLAGFIHRDAGQMKRALWISLPVIVGCTLLCALGGLLISFLNTLSSTWLTIRCAISRRISRSRVVSSAPAPCTISRMPAGRSRSRSPGCSTFLPAPLSRRTLRFSGRFAALPATGSRSCHGAVYPPHSRFGQVTVLLANFQVGIDRPMFLIAGPCVIEGETLTQEIAGTLKDITSRLGVPFIFKASYDKANRSSAKSFRGPGIDAGLKVLQGVKREDRRARAHRRPRRHAVRGSRGRRRRHADAGIPVRQTNFIVNVCSQGKPVNIKKGQFLSPWEMQNVVDKARSTGNQQIMVCERGFSFGYNNLVSDMRSLSIMRATGARWCSTPRIRSSYRAGWAAARAGSASTSRCWRAPRSRRASPACSWKRIRIRPRRCPTDRMPGRSDAWKSCCRRSRRSTPPSNNNPSRKVFYESHR